MEETKKQQIDFYVESLNTLNAMKDQHEEMKTLFKKMRQAFNGLIAMAAACFLPLLYSFVSINVTVGKLQETTMPKDDTYRYFVQKVDALAVHMYEDKWVRTQLYNITKDQTYKDDNTTPQLIQSFFKEEERSAIQLDK